MWQRQLKVCQMNRVTGELNRAGNAHAFSVMTLHTEYLKGCTVCLASLLLLCSEHQEGQATLEGTVAAASRARLTAAL